MTFKALQLIALVGLVAQPSWANPDPSAPQAPAAGFTSQDLESAAQAGRINATTRNSRIALAQTERLRALFVRDPRQAWASLSRDEAGVLVRALNPGTPVRDLAISWFMRNGAVQASSIDGGQFTGLYSPIADVWLLLNWAEIGGAWRIIDASWLPARNMSNVPKAQSEAPFLGFAASYQLALSRFADKVRDQTPSTLINSRAAMRAGDQKEAEASIDVWLASLKSLYDVPIVAARLNDLPNRLVASSQTRGSPFASLPVSGLQTFAPMGVLSQQDERAIILGSPFYPTLLIYADYGDSRLSRDPRFTLVRLSDVASTMTEGSQ